MEPNIGQVYKSFREDIQNPKQKYHLYLADDIVFLINSDRNLFDFDITLEKQDCSILTKDCYLQLKQVYIFDKRYPVIELDDMSTDVLQRMLRLFEDKTITKRIPKIIIKRIIVLLGECIEKRNNILK